MLTISERRATKTIEYPRTILVAHNRYRRSGGEDLVFASEGLLLEQAGHRVIRREDDNSRIEAWGVKAAVEAVWSSKSARAFTDLIQLHNPDVAHFHNTFPLISPAAYYAAQKEGTAVVQTLHNFRLLCPGATLFREGRPCEECIQKKSLRPAIAHACYRGSRPATAAVATMLTVHRAVGTWRRKVDLYIALSEFARRKFIEGGLPASRIVVKPNFVSPDPGIGTGSGKYALFVGRLSAEKGIAVLASAWNELSHIPLLIAGDGPLAGMKWPWGATWIGRQPRERILALMREARVLIFPSECYEGAPMTILEAFACGLPVIASNLGSMAEMVTDQRTGLLFTPGDAADLARKVRWAFEHREAMQNMRVAARHEFEGKYTAEINYKMLIGIYEDAIERARKRHNAQSAPEVVYEP
jgi:glycosyltransferase involved in cell wall biosynthesis